MPAPGEVGAVDQHEMNFTGPARVFDAEEDMLHALEQKKIRKGDVVVMNTATKAQKKITGGVYPLTNTGICPTPGTCEIFCATRVSARSSTCVSGTALELSASVRIGASAGLTLA